VTLSNCYVLQGSKECQEISTIQPRGVRSNFQLIGRQRQPFLNWVVGGDDLECTEPLLRNLKDAQSVHIGAEGVPSGWISKLLSLNSNLVSFCVPWMQDDPIEDCYPMSLPRLIGLSLGNAPSNSAGTASPFLANLSPPNLIDFRIYRTMKPQILSSLDLGCVPARLVLRSPQASGGRSQPGQAEAMELVVAPRGWKRLEALGLRLETSTSEFWNTLILLLTPNSRESLTAGWNTTFLLPRLISLCMNKFRSPAEDPTPVLDCLYLAAFVASR